VLEANIEAVDDCGCRQAGRLERFDVFRTDLFRCQVELLEKRKHRHDLRPEVVGAPIAKTLRPETFIECQRRGVGVDAKAIRAAVELRNERREKLAFSSALMQHSPLDRPVSRPHLDVALRELISQLQARAQRVDEAPMPRFRPSVDLHEKGLVLLQTARTAFHGTLHWLALQVCRNSAVSGSNGLKEICFNPAAAEVGPAACAVMGTAANKGPPAVFSQAAMSVWVGRRL
jgi:hypothetical protein